MPLDVHRTAQEKTECDVHLHFFHLTKNICLNNPTLLYTDVLNQFLQLSDFHKTNMGRKTIRIKGRRNKKSSNSCPNRRL